MRAGLLNDADLRLAGYALAHALGSIDGGGTLCTLAFVQRDDERELVRYEADSTAESIALARTDLRTRLGPTDHAALVYDVTATIDRAQHDALQVELIGPDGTVVVQFLQAYLPGRFGPASLLRLLGVPVPGGLSVVGRPIAQSSLPQNASAALTRGLADHPYGRRAYRLSGVDSDFGTE